MPIFGKILQQAAYMRPDQLPQSSGVLGKVGLVVYKVIRPFALRHEKIQVRLLEKFIARLQNQKSLFGFAARELQTDLDEIKKELRKRGVKEAQIAERAVAIFNVNRRFRHNGIDLDRVARAWPFVSVLFRIAACALANIFSLEYIFGSKASRQREFERVIYTDKQFEILPQSIQRYRANGAVLIDFENLTIPETTRVGWNPILHDLQLSVLCHLHDTQHHRAFRGVLAAHRVIETLLEEVFLASTHDAKRRLVSVIDFWTSIALQLVQSGFRPSPLEFRSLYRHLLRCKAIEIDILAARHRITVGAPESVKATLRKMRPSLEERIRISTRHKADRENPSLRAYRLELREEFLEFYLRTAVTSGVIAQELEGYSWEQSVGRLPQRTMLIDIMRHRAVDVDRLRSTENAFYAPDRYAAIVIWDQETYHDLGEAVALDKLVLAHIGNLSGEQYDPFGRCIYHESTRAGSRGEEAWRESACVLGELLLGPVISALSSIDHLIISPDDLLTRLPFETLAVDADRLVIDCVTVSYVDSPRDIGRWDKPPSGSSGTPCVLGDPDFTSGGGEYHGGFTTLEGTRREAEIIGRMLGVIPLTGAGATETEVKRLLSPRILHIATHGYFFHHVSRRTQSDVGSTASDMEDRLTALALLDHPLLRSGLALAGANTWLAGGHASRNAQDGLLTAQDVLEMDLSGTQLVVLSACETGLGDARSGQGVFGLRRTFAIAGARSLVMSLWKVPDEPTCLLMEAFYRNLLAGKGRSEALRNAQFELRAIHPHPRDWAAFVCLGDPGPLIGQRIRA